MQVDEKWMQLALQCAEYGRGHVHPNPLVGAVVIRGDRFVSKGFHRVYGGPHAEVEALRRAGRRAKGATLVVSLEPCAHWGKTPPCTDAIRASGIRQVVAAMRDPFPSVAGRGFKALRRAGIRVDVGLLERDARRLNRAFLMRVERGRPYVTLKVASSLDGKIATATGQSKWITGGPARRWGHRLRSQVDAVAVGLRTVLKDDPILSSHGEGRDPQRIVFDSRLRIPLKAKLLHFGAPLWVVTSQRSSEARRRALEKRGARVIVADTNEEGRVDVVKALRGLAQEGLTHLLVEGGGELHADFLQRRMADEMFWMMAPLMVGGAAGIPSIGGRGVRRLADAWRLSETTVSPIGDDFCVHGFINS